jgi:hypothetical protein
MVKHFDVNIDSLKVEMVGKIFQTKKKILEATVV